MFLLIYRLQEITHFKSNLMAKKIEIIKCVIKLGSSGEKWENPREVLSPIKLHSVPVLFLGNNRVPFIVQAWDDPK